MTDAKFKVLCAMAEIAGITEKTGLPAETIVNESYEEECRLAALEKGPRKRNGTSPIIEFQSEPSNRPDKP